jgi:hypothetical protein
MAPKGPSRLEVNRDVRRILVRHGVDTTKLHFTCTGKTITMTGAIYKDGGQEIALQAVDAVFRDISRLGYRVYCEFENWTVSDGAVMKKGQTKENKKQANNSTENKDSLPNSLDEKKSA